jgi:ubiquinone/menaquinone biosynthesis C-methylase UbiE
MNSDKQSKDVLEAYEKISSDYETTVKSDILDHRYIEHFLQLLKSGKRVLDLGAGTGVLSEEMYINLFTESDIKKYLDDIGFSIINTQRRNPEVNTEFPFYKLFIIAQKNS